MLRIAVEPSQTVGDLLVLRRLLDGLMARHVASLEEYFVPQVPGFRHRLDEGERQKIPEASTATCILSLLATRKWEAGAWSEKAVRIVDTILRQDWKSADLKPKNPFTTAWVVECVVALQENLHLNRSNDDDERLDEAKGVLRKALSDGGVSVGDYPPSAYVTQLALRALRRAEPALCSDLEPQCSAWALGELHRQLALHLASSKRFDPYQLAYATLIVHMTARPDRMKPDDKLMISKALEVFFHSQLEDGSWPRSLPLFHYPASGNAYCFEYELLTQLVACTTLRPELAKYLIHLRKTVSFVEETAHRLPNGGWGWSSGHHPHFQGPESWSTASVYHFCHVLDRLLAEATREAVFREIDVVYHPPVVMQEVEFAADLWDCPLYYEDERLSLKETLQRSLVEPLKEETSLVATGGRLSNRAPVSAIFFGPPGTSKTELASKIANHLGWPLLTVDPSFFVRNGFEHIQTQAEQLFTFLTGLEGAVVLFDEFDEMVRARHKSEDKTSRFITTAMLPKLSTLSKIRKILVVVATNYIDNFDIAIRRPGRFDLSVQVMPPSWQEKLSRSKTVQESAPLRSMFEQMDEPHRRKVEDMTFAEWHRFLMRLQANHPRTAVDLLGEVDKMFERCTLSTPGDPDQGGQKTWSEICVDQRRHTRLLDV